MFANIKKIKISTQKEITCMDLTYGYLLQLGSGEVVETIHEVVMDGTELSMDEVLVLRKADINLLYLAISQLTYPESYNDDGTFKKIEETTKKENKKKA